MSELLEAKINVLIEALQGALDRIREIEAAYKEMPPDARLDPQALDSLPWEPFKNRAGQWCFSDKAPDLKRALLECGSSVEIGGYKYRLSGDENRFIQRFPMK